MLAVTITSCFASGPPRERSAHSETAQRHAEQLVGGGRVEQPTGERRLDSLAFARCDYRVFSAREFWPRVLAAVMFHCVSGRLMLGVAVVMFAELLA